MNVPIIKNSRAQHLSVSDKAEVFAKILSQICQIDVSRLSKVLTIK